MAIQSDLRTSVPSGKRRYQRWLNVHHIECIEEASIGIEDLMENMCLRVQWRSNFEKLAKHPELQEAFMDNSIDARLAIKRQNPHHDTIKDTEYKFKRLNQHSRSVLKQAIQNVATFMEAVEFTILSFLEWQELPSNVEIPTLATYLAQPMQIIKNTCDDAILHIPLVDSAYRRRIIHVISDFYGIQSKTEWNSERTACVIKLPIVNGFRKASHEKLPMCHYLHEAWNPTQIFNSDDVRSRNSECSDGYCIMDFPET